MLKGMKKYMLIGAAAVYFLAPAQNAVAQNVVSADGTSIDFADNTKPGEVNVRWNNGKVTIIGHSDPNVRVEFVGKKKRDRERANRARGLTRVFAGDAVGYEVNGNRIDITCFSYPNSVNVEIFVPQNAFLSFENKRYGEFAIRDFDGEMEINTQYAKISIENSSGPVIAYSQYGTIEADLRDINPNKPLSFKTGYGDIDIALPADLKATLDLKTNQEIYTDFDFKALGRGSTRRGIEYAINGGGVGIEIKTTYASLYIRKK